ncbi:MAG: hypothetical protein G01um101431_82 [Parcubacteria group bacterium Gr01-1014_31]|nr:MAG: hypothetical protein G01um101431_82 [Parcubacteria group bacterium Gr01-1014_31]
MHNAAKKMPKNTLARKASACYNSQQAEVLKFG